MKSYLLILACFTVFLASCIDTTASTQPNLLIVKRIDPLHQLEKSEFEKSIDDKKEVKEIYDKLLDLSPFPKGTISCPADNGVHYELTFVKGDQTVSTAMVNALGCQGVTMNNKAFWAMEPKGKGFRALLEHALDLSDTDFQVGFASR